MGWFFALQQIEQGIGKSKHGRSIEPGARDARIFTESKESPVNQGHTVQQKESFVVIHKGGKDKKDWEILYEGSHDDFSMVIGAATLSPEVPAETSGVGGSGIGWDHDLE
jgi:hypothetical protein